MKVLKKFGRVLKWLLLALLVIAVVAAIAFKIYTSNYYKADKEVIKQLEDTYAEKVHTYSDDNGMAFIPQGQEIKAVIMFYPGGKVEYTAYSSLMYELADRGYVCLLPRMPENLAFLRLNAADKLLSGHEEEATAGGSVNWYLAGHSLGGVAASKFLKDEDGYAGLILCASYPTVDFSDSDIRLLSIYGDKDGVLNRENYEESKTLWPADSTEYVIQGGNHAYFGSYGLQDGDGEPDITNLEQIQRTADIISEWIK